MSDSVSARQKLKNMKDTVKNMQVTVVTRGKQVDWVAVTAGLVVIVSGILMYNRTTHTMPQTSTTFTVLPVGDLGKLLDLKAADVFESLASFETSPYHTASNLHAVGALKYTLGCYGRVQPILTTGAAAAGDNWAMLSNLQLDASSSTAISVCTCIDAHVDLAFGEVLFDTQTLNSRVQQYLTAVASFTTGTTTGTPTFAAYALRSHEQGTQLSRMSGNVPVRLSIDAQYEQLAEIHTWCKQSAAPVYTMHTASVWNSRLLLLVGVSLVLIGLDLFSTRNIREENVNVLKWTLLWTLDMIPFLFFVIRLFEEMFNSPLIASGQRQSFLMIFIFAVILVTMLLLVFFSLWANWKERRTGIYNALWNKIFVDLPMLVGLAVMGVALKLQNDEHDELVLMSTLLLLLTGGLLQHISNIVKVVYDIVCNRFDADLLTALNTGADYVKDVNDATKLHRTRIVLQHFGWTRLYGFFTVVLCAILSWTISATTSLSHNALQFITQNQYVYFVLAYIIALTGLDLFYEAIPFVTEKDTQYGEVAADRLRKLFVCIYLSFLLLSQYMIEVSEK
jgi:hypothetical protein